MYGLHLASKFYFSQEQYHTNEIFYCPAQLEMFINYKNSIHFKIRFVSGEHSLKIPWWFPITLVV